MPTPNEQLLCLLRKCWIKSTPEERVRQALIYDLINQLAFPASHLAVEMHLSQLPHLKGKFDLPNRRADLIVFFLDKNFPSELKPLLLIECKAHTVNNLTMRQLWGYNYFVQAPFVAAVGNQAIRLEWQHPQTKQMHKHSSIPSYHELLSLY